MRIFVVYVDIFQKPSQDRTYALKILARYFGIFYSIIFSLDFFSFHCNQKHTELHHNCHISHHHGGILIEFAFSVPILILLLFFAHDHYRIYELKDKVKSSAYLAASMIQQITNTRSDKQLTKNDIAMITYASCLNFFHTNSMFNPWPLGLYYSMDYFWIKRINSDSYQFQQAYTLTTEGNSPTGMIAGFNPLQTKTQTQVTGYHPDLICIKDGEERLLIKTWYRKTSGFTKSKIGLFILDIGPKKDNYGNFLKHEIVITPKPGLFPGKK